MIYKLTNTPPITSSLNEFVSTALTTPEIVEKRIKIAKNLLIMRPIDLRCFGSINVSRLLLRLF